VDDVHIQNSHIHNSSSFNGATANSPWMTSLAKAVAAPLTVLQWGHGEFAVDDRSTMFVVPGGQWLQWGHGEFAVDDTSLHAVLV